MLVEEYMALAREQREQHLGTLEPRELLDRGIELFNAGHYWHSHEAWEEVWIPSEQPLRALYQGLIQVAAGFVHLTRNEYPGTEKLLEEGLAKLQKYQPDFLTVDVEGLVSRASAARQRVIELGPKRLKDIDPVSLPRIVQRPLPQSCFFEHGSLRLHYLEWVSKSSPVDGAMNRAPTSGVKTLVLFHPPGYVAGIWQPVAAGLAEQGYRVVAPDLPGHGISQQGTGNIEEDIELLQRWLRGVAAESIAIISLASSAGLGARLATAVDALEVCMAPNEAFGPGDGDALHLRRRVWQDRWEMFRTLRARPQFARWRADLLWTYIEDGTVAPGAASAASTPTDIELRCADETELRFLGLGRPLDGAIEIDASPLIKPVEAVQGLLNRLSGA